MPLMLLNLRALPNGLESHKGFLAWPRGKDDTQFWDVINGQVNTVKPI